MGDQPTMSTHKTHAGNYGATQNSGMAIAMPLNQKTDAATIQEMFVSLLKDIYGAEQHFTTVLQRMYSAATTGLVQNTLKDIQFATKRYTNKLEKVFALLGSTAEARKSAPIATMTHEAEQVIAETPEHSTTRDAGLILSAQRMEQYGIATYNDLVYAAHALGHSEAACILEDILREREYTDIELTDIAVRRIHPSPDDAAMTEDDN